MMENLTASQNRGGEVLAVTVALFVAATFTVILRFISRVGIVKRMSEDDYAMTVAWVREATTSFGIASCYINIKT